MIYMYILYIVHVGARSEVNGQILYDLFHRHHFRISVTKDAATVEVCGAIKVRTIYMYHIPFSC